MDPPYPWAYVFTCEKSLEEMLTQLNEAGPWTWELRDSAWYADYLSTRLAPGIRIRIHEFPSQGSEAGVYVGPGTVDGLEYHSGYTALLQIRPGASTTQEEVDEIFQGLLGTIEAQNVKAISPYD